MDLSLDGRIDSDKRSSQVDGTWNPAERRQVTAASRASKKVKLH